MKENQPCVEEERNSENFYEIYTDGSCDNVKSKVGGSAYIILHDDVIVKRMSKGFTKTTNNRMEMLAIISAINSLPEESSALVHTDSKYCITVFDGEQHQANQDLIELFGKVSKKIKHLEFVWVKGHSGNQYNEMADEMAFGAYCDKARSLGLSIPAQMFRNH